MVEKTVLYNSTCFFKIQNMVPKSYWIILNSSLPHIQSKKKEKKKKTLIKDCWLNSNRKLLILLNIDSWMSSS